MIKRLRELGDTAVATCVIVRGELIFMTEKSQRRDENLDRVQRFLDDIHVYPVDEEASDIYGRLKSAILSHFGPKDRKLKRRTKTETLGFSENDLWIAAVAKRHGMTVVSADSDFKRMQEVGEISLETWYPSAPDNR